MRSIHVAVVLALMMAGASVGAIYVRPNTKAADLVPPISLETIIPKQFGEWHELAQQNNLVVNPQTQEILDKIYSQIVTRTYENAEGYRVMLSVAYGSDQRGELQAHKPEVCYPAQGFKLHKTELLPLSTAFGAIPAQRLFTSKGARQEPVTYWFTVGNKAVQSKLQKRLVEMSYGLTGRIPDGLLFRVSSLDGDQRQANRYHDEFVNQLLQAVPTNERTRLSGLGG